MKKALGVLVVLLMVSPALADVNMTVTDAGGGWADISYNATGEPNLPRAFALKVEVDTGSMDAVQFAAGTDSEACPTCQDFKIHPGNIQIDGNGNVVSWGRPVAPGNAPDNPPQLPSTTYIIIEMGSLYEKGVDPAPLPSGLLIRVHVTASCTMTVSEEATVRGGVVLEDPAVDPTVNGDSTAIVVYPPRPGCWDFDTLCYGDSDGDNDADFTDVLVAWKDSYNPGGAHPDWNSTHGTGLGEYNPCADFDQDGSIGFSDALAWKDAYIGLDGVKGTADDCWSDPQDLSGNCGICSPHPDTNPWPPAGYPS